MRCHTEFHPDQLGEIIKIDAPPLLSHARARALAGEAAAKRLAEPMLLGWYESASGRFSPQVECCDEEKPGWVVYAQSRGGEMAVEVGRGDYYFIFGEGALS